MKNIFAALIVCVISAVPALAGAGCGDPKIMASLFHNAVFADDRDAAERQLLPGALIVSPCLSRQGYNLSASLIPGRLGIVLAILGAMRQESAAMSTPDDVDRQLRLWQAQLAGR